MLGKEDMSQEEGQMALAQLLVCVLPQAGGAFHASSHQLRWEGGDPFSCPNEETMVHLCTSPDCENMLYPVSHLYPVHPAWAQSRVGGRGALWSLAGPWFLPSVVVWCLGLLTFRCR